MKIAFYTNSINNKKNISFSGSDYNNSVLKISIPKKDIVGSNEETTQLLSGKLMRTTLFADKLTEEKKKNVILLFMEQARLVLQYQG